jgi:hypothetical protein
MTADPSTIKRLRDAAAEMAEAWAAAGDIDKARSRFESEVDRLDNAHITLHRVLAETAGAEGTVTFADAKRLLQMQAEKAAKARSAQYQADDPDRPWWCPTCGVSVQCDHVTYEETHDTRCGGCGMRVLPEIPKDAVEGTEADRPKLKAPSREWIEHWSAVEAGCDGVTVGKPIPQPAAGPEAGTTGRIHELKTWPEFYERVASSVKTFEIRKNDRGFAAGDTLILMEFDPAHDAYTGRVMARDVSYVTDFAQQPGYVVMGLVPAVQPAAVSDAEGRNACEAVHERMRSVWSIERSIFVAADLANAALEAAAAVRAGKGRGE